MNKYMKVSLFLIFMCWGLSAFSGCVASEEGEFSSVSVENIKVRPLSEGNSTPVSGVTENVLNVTACIINAGKEDSSVLLIRFKLEESDSIEPTSSREVATKKCRT
ncbi:hypothetical protein [Methanosarcina horonobensis]|uniref:hypothetical protein n=1 Tax=Methanosarcina horonobensis TaxID=418008 RepID=UPI000AB81456|nr:hypothetical protein [Methanosarcina horonobensis]